MKCWGMQFQLQIWDERWRKWFSRWAEGGYYIYILPLTIYHIQTIFKRAFLIILMSSIKIVWPFFWHSFLFLFFTPQQINLVTLDLMKHKKIAIHITIIFTSSVTNSSMSSQVHVLLLFHEIKVFFLSWSIVRRNGGMVELFPILLHNSACLLTSKVENELRQSRRWARPGGMCFLATAIVYWEWFASPVICISHEGHL